MKFGTAKTVMMSLLLAAFVIALAGTFLLEEGTGEYTLTTVLAVVLLAAGLLVGALWGRCPSCGKHLFFKLLQWKSCPACRRALDPAGRYRPKTKGPTL